MTSPWITDVPSIANFRMLTSDQFPHNLVYRSATLSNLTLSDLPALSRHISVIIDVRSPPEIQKQGTIGCPTLTVEQLRDHDLVRIEAPVFTEVAYSPENIAKRHLMYRSGVEGFVSAYRGILDNFGDTLRILFHAMAKQIRASGTGPGRGILIHCSAGKDRTGILCAILLLLAGTPVEVVADEYQLTEIGLATQTESLIQQYLSNNTQEDLGKGNSHETVIREMMSAKKQVMVATIKVIDQEYGGVEALCRKHASREDCSVVVPYVRSRSAISTKL